MKKRGKELELPFSPILAAVRLAGGVSRVAEILQVQRPTIYSWIHRGRLVNQKTHDYAAELHRLSGINIDQLICGIDGGVKISDPKKKK